jgi:hypothetical protein
MSSVIVNILRRGRSAALLMASLPAMVASAHADNLVFNGSFDQPGNPGDGGSQVASNMYSGITMPGWTATGYVQYVPVGGGNAPATSVGASPNGGNFMLLDGDPVSQGTISQVIHGLTVGSTVTVSFEMAAANYFFVPNQPTT